MREKPAVEEVLCLRREDVVEGAGWRGLRREGLAEVLRTIAERSFFMPRPVVEEDPSYQQVIPYAVFGHGGRYLLTHRLRASSERRLRRQYSLGVGGHINPADALGGDLLAGGLGREWAEEVEYSDGLEVRPLGLLKEESSPVGRVHLGIVFLFQGDSPAIRIRETDKLSGELLTLSAMRVYYLGMESWSQVIYDHLASGSEGLGRPAPPV